MNHPLSELTFYAVQNSDGQWFHRKGYNGYGKTWTDNPALARIYTKIGQARSIVTFFANNYSSYPVPDLVEIKPGEINILNESERVEKAKQKKLKAEAAKKIQHKKWQLEQAQKELQRAQAVIDNLK